MGKNSLFIILIGFVFYFLSTGMTFAVLKVTSGNLSGLTSQVTPIASKISISPSSSKIDPQAPKTEACPLNGQMFTKQEKDIWESRRPLAVMVENHEEARPQSGLSDADIVYEAVAEGGITRFLAVFYCGAAAKNLVLAPVRSARTYYLDWVSEYDALYNHVGGAGRCNDDTVDERAKALCQIDRYGIKDLDQFSISFPNCYRNPDRTGKTVATEHQMVCFSDNLYNIAEKRGWTNVDEDQISWDKNFTSWLFKDDVEMSKRPQEFKTSFNFWSGYAPYLVTWEYDRETNSYRRINGGVLQKDHETGQTLTAKDVVIQFSRETGAVDDHKHLLYQTTGQGKAIIFQDGQTINGTWSKAKRTSRTQFFDSAGNQVKFNRGQIWIETLPTGTEVNY